MGVLIPNSELQAAKSITPLAIGIAHRRDAYYFPAMQTISLKLPEALLRQLEKEARLRRVTKSHLVRASLEKAFAEEAEGGAGTCYDLAHDLAGKLKGLPRDLATNPAHMRGFGQ
jgi:Arc/MetJ-type ribon-helix-helix transcriptional regulator